MADHKMTVRLPKELHKAAKMKAVMSEIALSEVVRQFLAKWVKGEIEPSIEPMGDEPSKNE